MSKADGNQKSPQPLGYYLQLSDEALEAALATQSHEVEERPGASATC